MAIAWVNHPQHELRLVEFFERALDTHVLNHVARFTNASGVDKTEERATEGDGVFYHIACGAFDVAH